MHCVDVEAERDHALQLRGQPDEPVGMPADHDLRVRDQEPLKLGADYAGGCGQVVVREDLPDLPSPALAEGDALLDLPLDPQLFMVAIQADPDIDTCSHESSIVGYRGRSISVDCDTRFRAPPETTESPITQGKKGKLHKLNLRVAALAASLLAGPLLASCGPENIPVTVDEGEGPRVTETEEAAPDPQASEPTGPTEPTGSEEAEAEPGGTEYSEEGEPDNTAKIGQKVTYSDGVEVEITKVKRV